MYELYIVYFVNIETKHFREIERGSSYRELEGKTGNKEMDGFWE